MSTSTVTKVIVIIAGITALLIAQFKPQKEDEPEVYEIHEVPKQK